MAHSWSLLDSQILLVSKECVDEGFFIAALVTVVIIVGREKKLHARAFLCRCDYACIRGEYAEPFGKKV